MLTTRWQPLGTAWPEMNRLQEEMEQWLGRARDERPAAVCPQRLSAAQRYGRTTTTCTLKRSFPSLS